MEPHSGLGGITPIPINERDAAESIDVPTPMVASTIIGAIQLGRMCTKRILMWLAPETLADSINSFSFNDITLDLTIRAYLGTDERLTAMIRFFIPFPRDAAIAIASTRDGIERTISIILMTILSKVLPKYPANAPIIVPIAPAMITDINPILREILAP